MGQNRLPKCGLLDLNFSWTWWDRDMVSFAWSKASTAWRGVQHVSRRVIPENAQGTSWRPVSPFTHFHFQGGSGQALRRAVLINLGCLGRLCLLVLGCIPCWASKNSPGIGHDDEHSQDVLSHDQVWINYPTYSRMIRNVLYWWIINQQKWGYHNTPDLCDDWVFSPLHWPFRKV